jgi:hypothetical protein
VHRQTGSSRAVAGIIARYKSGAYDYHPPIRLRVCPNKDCPKPNRTYAMVTVCPFCGTQLEYEEAA